MSRQTLDDGETESFVSTRSRCTRSEDLRVTAPILSAKSCVFTFLSAVDPPSGMTLLRQQRGVATRDDLEVRALLVSLRLDGLRLIFIALEQLSIS